MPHFTVPHLAWVASQSLRVRWQRGWRLCRPIASQSGTVQGVCTPILMPCCSDFAPRKPAGTTSCGRPKGTKCQGRTVRDGVRSDIKKIWCGCGVGVRKVLLNILWDGHGAVHFPIGKPDPVWWTLGCAHLRFIETGWCTMGCLPEGVQEDVLSRECFQVNVKLL